VDQAVSNIARWRAAPWVYVREVFKAEPDAWQDECLHALIESGLAKFCLKACKGPGKSCLMAWVIWWFLTCFSHPKILVTSITGDNLSDNLWAELAFWRNKSQMLCTLFEYQSEQIYARQHPDTWFASARTWPKEADQNKQAQTLAGLHAQNTLLVLDEAGGIPIGVLTAGLAHHSTQGKQREWHLTFIAGNPDTTDSALGWAATEDAEKWWVKEITGDPKDPKRAPRIDPVWAQEQIDRFGLDNPWVLVNVFGKFPPVGSDRLLGSDQVREAMQAQVPRYKWAKAGRVMALDVARSTGRDRSVLCRRQGPIVFPFLVYRLDNAVDLAGQIAFEYSRWPCKLIVVDGDGLGGPVADQLRALGLPVVEFHGGMVARDPRFVDRRTEVWYVGADEIKGKNKVPDLALPMKHQEIINELTAPKLEWNSKGQMKLESKEKMLKRGIASPDMADALMMSFAEPVAIDVEIPGSIQRAVSRPVPVDYDPYNDEIDDIGRREED
jgi:hypothetical protein